MLRVVNKRSLHHYWTKIKPFGAKYFLIAAFVCLVIGIGALRQNNITALKLRDEVSRVDQENGDVESALRDLREHVHSHMNSGLAGGIANVQQPVQLKYRYERLVSDEKAKVSTQNERIYNDAQEDCERRFPSGLSGSNRIPCIEAYVSAKSIKEQPIPDALYKFDFVAPTWSFDLAGISLLFSGVFLLLAFTRVLIDSWMKRQFHSHI